MTHEHDCFIRYKMQGAAERFISDKAQIASVKQGRRNEKRARAADFVEGHRQNFNYVKIHTLEFRGSVAFLLHQIPTDHILSIASAITLDIINTSQISSIDSATVGFIITN